jgi:hypothetical protein
MSVSPEQVAAGHAVYTKRMLGIYDFLVLGLSNRLIWRCPTRRLVEQARHGEWMSGLEPAIFSTVLQTRHGSR